MTAYVMSASGTLRDIGNASIWGVATARTGGDTIDLNGFNVTQDQDSRYGLSGTTSTTWGNITVNASKGGKFIIDATKVWMIPFTGGSGTLTLGTQITIGGVTCNTVGIYTSLTVAPATTGASGWLKVTNVSAAPGTISNGTYAGFTLTANGAAIRGFIEVNGDESAGFIANRLGSVEMTGAWFLVGSTSGSSATTYQLPTNGSVQYYPAVWVDSDSVAVTGASWASNFATFTVASHLFQVGEEVTVTGATPSGYNVTDAKITARTATTFTVALASNPGSWTSGGSAVVPEAYPCAGSLVAASSTATDVRGKCHWSSTGGVLRFGSDGTNTVGYVPPSGRRIRIPNILTANNTTAARTVNVLPNATLATRYDWTTTGGGVVLIDKALLNWYPSFAQAYSVNLAYTGIATQLSISELAQPCTMVGVCVGQEAANTQTSLSMSLNFAGGTFSSCVFTRSALATAVFVTTLTDCAGFNFNNCRTETRLVKANVGAATWSCVRVANSTWTDNTTTGGKLIVTTCTNLTFTNSHYRDRIVGTTQTTAAENNSVWELSSNCSGITMDGLDFSGLTNVQPYVAILSLNAAGCTNIKLRRMGTSPSSLLSLGSTNATGTVCAIATGGAASDVKLQRLFLSNTRTNLFSGDNSSSRVTIENCMGDYADAPVSNMLNLICKGIGATPSNAAQTAVYGTHWSDRFTSATVGAISILMNEPTVLTASQVALTGGAAFTAAGGLYMPTIGMTATFTMPYFSLGHTQFTNSALTMGGGTATNYTYAYQIDTGAGFGAFSSELTATTLGSTLNGLGAITPSTGFKLKLRITTGTTNTTAITSVTIATVSTAVAQANYYPLDTVPVTVTVKDVNTLAPVENARVLIEAAAGGSAPVGEDILSGLTNASGVVTATAQYISQPVVGKVRRASAGFGTLYKNSPISATITSAGLDLTVLLIPD